MPATIRRSDAGATRPQSGLQRLLLATDFSPDARSALLRTAMLPFERQARIALLHVLPPRFSRAADSVVRSAAQDRLELSAKSLRSRLAARRRTDVRVVTRLMRGSIPDEIGRLAGLIEADLVVVGRRGKRALRERLIGSVAERVARHARVPVLIVARAPAEPYRAVTFGFDLSDTAIRAARLAGRLLPPRTRVLVVHALPLAFAPRGAARQGKALAGERIAAEAAIRRRLPPPPGGGTTWSMRLRQGDPRRAILDAARQQRADLIVLGSTGRTGLPRRLIGSTAEGVLHQAPVDVLIAPSR
jgi:nucleotide-binding universal stress UspA family protein